MMRFNILLVFVAILALVVVRPAADRSEPSECEYSEHIPPVEDYERLISFSDPYIGTFDAPVTVIEFFDPNCPHCKTLHPMMKEVIAANEDAARFFMIPFVLWQYSLPHVEALYVAAQEDKYFEMMDLQYRDQKKGGMTVDELADLAGEIGMDRERFLRRLMLGLNQRGIIDRRSEIMELGLTGTPAVMINGRFVDAESKSVRCLNDLIRRAAQEAGDRETPQSGSSARNRDG